jgi:Na+-driven multidrug efflux pump
MEKTLTWVLNGMFLGFGLGTVIGSAVHLGLWAGRYDVWNSDYHYMFAWTFGIGALVAVLMYVLMKQQAPDDGPQG